ncbi:MAG: hypothetical protein ACK5JF_02490 [Oscillospiraceae bacterium]
MHHIKKSSILLAFVMIFVMLTACGDDASSGGDLSIVGTSSNISVTVHNLTDYNFNQLFVSPTAANKWGEDHLGSTNILKKNGDFAITLPAYDYNSYDVRIIDEDDDEYLFSRVTLLDGAELAITFGEDGLVATSILPDGSEESVIGALNGGSNDTGGTSADGATDYQGADRNGNDSAGRFSFDVYNNSDFDIYAIYMGVRDASSDQDLDILPSILPGNNSSTVSGQASQGDWMNTEWTLYIVDVDGDSSASYDIFNPWLLSAVNVSWDSANGGYVCEFIY